MKSSLGQAIDQFWMQSQDLRMLEVVRRGYGLLLLVNVGLLWIDRHRFFGDGSMLPAEAAQGVVDPDTFNLYTWLPAAPAVITAALGLLLIAGVALLLGVVPRLAAAATFLLLICVQHANMMLFDAEDVVFRLFAFFFIFVPPWSQLQRASQLTADAVRDGLSSEGIGFPAWPLRLFQLQVCLIYLATALQKSNGEMWLEGTAVYYALRLDDLTKFPLPTWITESLTSITLLSWATVALEFAVPIFIWWRSLKWLCLLAAVAFHLGTDYSLNLNLFHWIMLLGLVSFVSCDDLAAIRGKLGKHWLHRRTS